MSVIVRIVRKAFGWTITILPDQANAIAFDAASLAVSNANGKFRMHAKGADGDHLAVMADIIIGPENPKDYAAMTGAVQ